MLFSNVLTAPARCTALALLFAIVSFATPAFATPDANGTWTGQISGQLNSCNNLNDNGPDSGSLTLVLTQNGGAVTGSGTYNGSGQVTGLSGSFDGDQLGGSFNYTDSDGVQGEGYFLATISGDTLHFDDLQTYDQVGDSCIGVYSGRLTRSNSTNLETQPGEVATNERQLRTQVTNFTNAIGSHLRNLTRGARGLTSLTGTGGSYEAGLAAGDGQRGMGAWASYNYTDLSNDFSGGAYDGDAHNVVGGFDYRVHDKAVVGVAVGWETSDIDTPYNGGNVEKDGITVAPYVAILVNDVLSLDGSFGYSDLDTDQSRLVGATNVTASNGSERWFGSANVTGMWQMDSWLVSPRAGFMYATEDVDGFTESNGNFIASRSIEFGQVYFGGEVSYLWGNFEPVVGAVYELDFAKDEYSALDGNGNLVTVNRDDDNVLFNAGIRYYHNSGVTASVEYRGRFGRQYVNEDNVTATLRIDF